MSFKRLDPEDFLISADSVTAGAWEGDSPTLTTFFTSSNQEAGSSGEYYLDIYKDDTESDSTLPVQFAIAFGDSAGSGSILFDPGIDGRSPSSTVFGQFQNIVLGDENNEFIFGGETPDTQSIYVISVDRARYKGNIFPGTLDLRLSGNGGSSILQLTDDSNDATTVTFNEAGRVYQVVSGSNGSAISGGGKTSEGSYGLFLPDIGCIVLNTKALDLAHGVGGGCGLGTEFDSNTNNNNTRKLYEALEDGGNFTLNSQENLTSDFIFVRARNSEYNYSENLSFISGSEGEVTYTEFINSPQTFITTVGLYNDNSELLAVAKLSKPLKKDFTKETLIRVKLDF